jgi:hypothetical protein
VGVGRHQLDIFALRLGTNEEAGRVAAGGSLPWQAVTQIMYLGCIRPDGSSFVVYPDMMVFPRAMSRDRGFYSLKRDGAPVLIIEVASDATVESDLDLERGKGWSYAHASVREYLVLDPTRQFIPEEGRGWRLLNDVYVPWEQDTSGRWRSQEIGVAYGVENGLAAVYSVDRRQLREGEVAPALEAERIEGRLQAKREIVRRLARQRFGAVTALEKRIDMATEADLDMMIDRALTATDPDTL